MTVYEKQRPIGVGFDIGVAPHGAQPFPRIASANLGSILAERADYDWQWVFQSDRTAPVGASEAASFLDFYDATDGEDLIEAKGKRWRAAGANLPTVNASSANFNSQPSITFPPGTSPSGLIRRKVSEDPPASFTHVFAFHWVRPGSNGVNKAVMHYLRTGGTAGVRVTMGRVTDTTDRILFTPDQTSGVTQHIYTTAAALADGPYIGLISFDGDNDKSETWLNGQMVSQFTHSGGVVSDSVNLPTLGADPSGASPYDGEIAMQAMSRYPMARRDGGGNLVKPDMAENLMRRLMVLYGIGF